MRRGLWMIFRWPLLLALLGLFGLLSALLGDGLYDLLSWLALGTRWCWSAGPAAPAANPKESLR